MCVNLLRVKVMSSYKGKFENNLENYSSYKTLSENLLSSVNFVGKVYRTALFWKDVIPVTYNKPVKYCEIGAFQGGNAISFGLIYGQHPQSEIHCIDPWTDYDEYTEYKNDQENNFKRFLDNVSKTDFAHKFYIHRGFSNSEIPQLEDEYFDIIYVDGNHEPSFIMEDAVLSYRKLKSGGYLVFDDYNWEMSSKGIDNFITAYDDKLDLVNSRNCQIILKKR